MDHLHSHHGIILSGINLKFEYKKWSYENITMPINYEQRLKISFILLFINLLFISVPASASKKEDISQLYNKALRDYYLLKTNKQKQQYRDVWLKTIKEFEYIYKNAPRSRYAPKALYNIGNLYNNLYTRSFLGKDLDSAIDAFKTLQANYKNNPLADDALFKIAEIYRTKKGNIESALHFYKLVVQDYPHSDSAPMARVWIEKLGGNVNIEKHFSVKKKFATLEGIRVWSGPDYTRVVISLSGEIVYSGHLLEQQEDGKPGKRVYIDLSGTMITSDIQPIIVKDGLVEKIRAGQFTHKIARVVLDVGNIDDYSIFNLEDPFRIIIDVKGKREINIDTASTELTKTTTEESNNGLTISKIIEDYEHITEQTQIPKNVVTKQSISSNSSIKRIVIDAGHGGHDPGAIGPNGIMEKNITLKIATILAHKLRSMGFDVIMTRDKDVFIPLEERTAIANMSNADLFISIHANASLSRRTKGITTYYLSATHDRASMIVAARENATSTKKLSDLQLILQDLMKTAKINDSALFAGDVQRDMVESLRKDGYKTPDLGVRSAPFFVLMHADMPSILIETSFITNPGEERLLEEKKYEESIVNGVVKGILQYGTKIKMAEQ